MPLLISRIWRSAGEASRSSTIRAIRPSRADDAAVAVGPLDCGRDHGGCGAGATVRLDQAPQRAGRQQRHVARTAARACPVRPARSGSACCSAWAVPSCGSWSANWSAGLAARRSRTTSARCPTTTVIVAGETRLGGPEHVLDHRPAGDRVQHLGQLRLHPRALAGGQDDDVSIRHRRRPSARDRACRIRSSIGHSHFRALDGRVDLSGRTSVLLGERRRRPAAGRDAQISVI